MDAVFLKLFNMSIAASWLIIAVIALRLPLRKAPRWLHCVLWAIVAVRLICPFSLESSLSLIPSAEILSATSVRYAQEPAIDSGVLFIDNTLNPIIGESFAPTPGASVNPMHIWMFAAGILWGIGFFGMLVYALVSFGRIRGKVREAIPLRDNIWLCDAVRSPFILGVLRPRIYLSSGTEEEQMKYILVHEQAHLKRRDHWWKPLGYLLLAVYWFNPLVWAAYILLCRDIEMACDEKAIKEMDLPEKKAYSNALVSCSMQRRMIIACPLAFGEVSVKERVKKVLNYRKPAFWIIIAAIVVCAAVAICFLTNPRRDTFDIKIVIPAGSERALCYSAEEISPTGKTVILSSGEGLGDTEVVLKPMHVIEENTYGPTYMTPGMPVKMDLKKGAWFKIGVAASNPTEEDMIVYVRAKGVTVRIADPAAVEVEEKDSSFKPTDDENGPPLSLRKMRQIIGNKNSEEDIITFIGTIVENTMDGVKPFIMVQPMGDEIPYEYVCFILPDGEADWANRVNSVVSITCKSCFEESQPPFGELISIGRVGSSPIIQGHESLDAAIYAAILEQNAPSYPDGSDVACCDFVTLEELSVTPLVGDETHTIILYGWELYQQYAIDEMGIQLVRGSHVPVALTFELDENGYQLKEYWQPRDGSYYVSDVRSKFPSHIVDDGLDSQKYITRQMQSCYKQAIEFSGLDTDAVVGNLLDTICSSPTTSSNPQDYIDAHSWEYRELLYYGVFTRNYCFGRFIKGNETGLKGKIMAIVCEELLQTKGMLPVDAGTAETGQLWYEKLMSSSSIMVEPYLE